MTSGRSIRVVVAIGVLVAGAPGLRHSHAAGDRPHHHDMAEAHDHNGLGEPHAHWHITLFGVEFTLPVESDNDNSDEGQCTFLAAVPIAIDLVQSSHFAAMAQPILNVGMAIQIVAPLRHITAIATPLSSNAHLEHSCVWLI